MGTIAGLRRWQSISAILSFLGLADSLYLWSFKLGQPLICGTGGCDVVNASPYSEILGIPVAAIGAAGYLALLALALWAFFAQDNAPYWLTDLRLFFAAMGVFFAAYLTVVELFIIHNI